MLRPSPAAALACALACALAPACAHGPQPPVITSANSPTRDEDRAERDLSRGGRERGAVEFTLAGVTAALSATLITIGAVQLHRGLEIRDYCATPVGAPPELPDDPACYPLTGDPYRNAAVSSGLSFFLAVPVAVASGFLVRRGLRVKRDYQEWRAANPGLARARLSPWAGSQGGGVALQLRF